MSKVKYKVFLQHEIREVEEVELHVSADSEEEARQIALTQYNEGTMEPVDYLVRGDRGFVRLVNVEEWEVKILEEATTAPTEEVKVPTDDSTEEATTAPTDDDPIEEVKVPIEMVVDEPAETDDLIGEALKEVLLEEGGMTLKEVKVHYHTMQPKDSQGEFIETIVTIFLDDGRVAKLLETYNKTGTITVTYQYYAKTDSDEFDYRSALSADSSKACHIIQKMEERGIYLCELAEHFAEDRGIPVTAKTILELMNPSIPKEEDIPSSIDMEKEEGCMTFNLKTRADLIWISEFLNLDIEELKWYKCIRLMC